MMPYEVYFYYSSGGIEDGWTRSDVPMSFQPRTGLSMSGDMDPAAKCGPLCCRQSDTSRK
jgi:hypothetical protein